MAEQTQEDVKKGLPADFVKTVREAESPFRDALKKYQDELTPEGKEAFQEIAHEEGKAAVEAYKQSKSLEDPRIDALRNLVAETIQLSPRIKEEYPKLAEELERRMKKIGMGEVDKIISNEEISFDKKSALIEGLGFGLNRGVGSALVGWDIDSAKLEIGRGPDIFSLERDERKKMEVIQFEQKTLLLGYFIAEVSRGYSSGGVFRALSAMAEVEGKKDSDIIEEFMPLIMDMRKEHPESTEDINDNLKNCGFLWSPGSEAYINFNQEIKK